MLVELASSCKQGIRFKTTAGYISLTNTDYILQADTTKYPSAKSKTKIKTTVISLSQYVKRSVQQALNSGENLRRLALAPLVLQVRRKLQQKGNKLIT